MLKELFAMMLLRDDKKLKKFVYDLLLTSSYFTTKYDEISKDTTKLKVSRQSEIVEVMETPFIEGFLEDKVLSDEHREKWLELTKHYLNKIKTPNLDLLLFKSRTNTLYYLFTLIAFDVPVIMAVKGLEVSRVFAVICLCLGLGSIFKMYVNPYDNALNHLCYKLIIATKEDSKR